MLQYNKEVIKLNLKEKLIYNFGYNEPILIKEVAEIEKTNLNNARQKLKRAVDKGEVKRYKNKNGIYYVAKSNSILKNSSISLDKVIQKSYLKDDKEVFGYISGLSFANKLGLTTQNPSAIEIVTNKESTIKRTVNYNIRQIILRKPRVKINKSNFKLLQVLDLFNNINRYNNISNEQIIKLVTSYLSDMKISEIKIKAILKKYPTKTQLKFYEMGLFNAVTSSY